MGVEDELELYRKRVAIQQRERQRQEEFHYQQQQEERKKMQKFLEEIGIRGLIAIEHFIDRDRAYLRTSEWVIFAQDKRSRGEVTSYLNPDILPLPQEDIATINQLLELPNERLRIEIDQRNKGTMFPELRKLLEFRHFIIPPGCSAVELCRLELWKREGWESSGATFAT